ncbi:MAG: hypothetical protein ACOYXT_26670 [Bacteroidota bacterium]
MTTQKEMLSDVMVFRTNIKLEADLKKIAPVLNEDNRIKKWNVDWQDIDHVLRIESDQLDAMDVIKLIQRTGYRCEELPDEIK